MSTSRPVLRKGSGIQDKSQEVVDAVKELQSLLGLSIVDGMFGSGTEQEVIEFQSENGLEADGVVGRDTWKRILSTSEVEEQQLEDFIGDLSWIHAREGHAGRAYWPGGASGVTLDPGFDLGHAKPELFEAAYKGILSGDEMEACRGVLGIKGENAKNALKNGSDVLKGIRLTRDQADSVFPFVATPYWKGIVGRYSELASTGTLGSVQTALLSISFNRGYGNSKLSVLDDSIHARDWKALADVIANMQQDHALEGIRKRRRMEAALIYDELGNV